MSTPVAAAWTKWISIGLIAVGLLLIVRQLPWRDAVSVLDGRIDSLGPWGPVLFAGLYAFATVLFVPGWILTVAAGGMFGPVTGTVAVSAGSTLGAAAAFLIARFVARRRVQALAEHSPRFRAVDEAVAEGGWRIVALLRLSPAIPFNVQNYVYGLMRLRFWPYVLASWLAMLPATFLYVYLGHVAGTAVTAGRQRTIGEWFALGVGLAATVAVTVYLTHLARRRLAAATGIEGGRQQAGRPRSPQRRVRPWTAAAAASLALLVIVAAAYAQANGQAIRSAFMGLLGPPAVSMGGAYGPAPGGPAFNHDSFDALLRTHVDDDGWVDYAGLREDEDRLDEYIEALGDAPFADLGRDEKLAFLINAYNAFTLKLILDHSPEGEIVDSIRDIPAGQRWKARRWRIGPHTWSLDQIEHEQIRPKFEEPRIHFALVCAAIGCPPLRDEAYEADRVADQLEDQARFVHEHDRWFRYDRRAGVVHLTELYKWYRGDFEHAAGSVLAYAARYAPALEQALKDGDEPRSEWIAYDWRLNSAANRDGGK